MMREERGVTVKPVILKLGLALALSFAGFIYSRFKARRIKPNSTLPKGISAGHGSEVTLGGGVEEVLSPCNTVSEGNYPYAQEETCTNSVISDNSPIGLSPKSKQNGEKDEFLLPEFNDLVKEVDIGATMTRNGLKKDVEVPMSIVESPIPHTSPEKHDYEQEEITQLRNKIRMLQDKEQSLEVQLLEYCGLREQETAVVELRNRLKISNMETKMLNLKVKTLQSEKSRLEEQVEDHAKVLAELETAKGKVKLLRKKIRCEAERNREQIIALQQRVAKLQDIEYKSAACDQDIQIQLQKLKELESEAEVLRKSNRRLQIENSHLARRLESTQILANSVLEEPELDAMKEESDHLRQENERLMKEIEQLQADRCSDVEELVYMRWINACLRYELRNYQPPHGKTVARDLSKSLSPTSEKKAKELILEYANIDGSGSINVDFDLDQWSSSQDSLTDFGECDDFSSVGNSSAARTSTTTSKTKFFSKLRGLIQGKDRKYGSQDDSYDFTSRNSFDLSMLNGMKGGDRRNSDSIVMGSSNKLSSWKRGSFSGSLCIEKSDLEKYAEALKDSSGKLKHQRLRSASYS